MSALVNIWQKIDKFVLAIAISAGIATLFPATGVAAPIVDWSSKILIGCLFFLYGARLEPKEALDGLKHWRLHLVILIFTFVLFPIVGLGLFWLSPKIISPTMYLGLVFMCTCPSTVQSSINFTSIARGNVAGAIVSASASNLLGVFITPILVFLTMGVTGSMHFDASSILDIMLQILLPFIIGQLSRRWTADFVHKNHSSLKYVDQGSIVLVVYSAFSSGRRNNMWSLVSGYEILIITGILLILLVAILWLTYHVAGWMKFSLPDQIAIQFCGTKKSLATGMPMATVLFSSQPVGIIVLPLMIFHMAQLIACGILASRYARRDDSTDHTAPPSSPKAASTN